jgi:hypothetical protein
MRAHLRAELRDAGGAILAVREAHNAVMRNGARLIAQLFAGQGAGITHMGVGTSSAPESEDFATEGLSNDTVGDLVPLQSPTEAELPPEAFTIELDETQRVVRVRVRGTLPPSAAVGTVREAGLISRSGETAILYNRVIFASMVKGDDHELTLFWEVTFPYGDLQWFGG